MSDLHSLAAHLGVPLTSATEEEFLVSTGPLLLQRFCMFIEAELPASEYATALEYLDRNDLEALFALAESKIPDFKKRLSAFLPPFAA